MAHVPNPGDWNSPGDASRTVAPPEPPSPDPDPELLKQLTRAEPDGAPAAPFDGGPIEERPRGGAIGDPNRELAQRMAPQEFAPIKQLGQELTFTIVVPDHRPSLNIPLQGPGAYKITIERRE